MDISIEPDEPMCLQNDHCKCKENCLRYTAIPFINQTYSFFSTEFDGKCNGYLTEEDFENADQEPETT